jgi:hypothetical protein
MKAAQLDVDEPVCRTIFTRTCTKFFIHTLSVITACFGTPHVASAGILLGYPNEESLMMPRVECCNMLG